MTKTKNTNIALPEQLWEDANILAVKKRISFTELVRRAVMVYVSAEHITEFTILSDGKIDPPEAAIVLQRMAARR